jgi:predicted transcriptional regulator
MIVCYICANAKHWSNIMAATTTIRLPPKLRARLGSLAKQTGRSAHSLIVEAVERHADHEEQMRNLVKEALAADTDIEKTGEVYAADDVHDWIKRLGGGESAQRPKPWRR